MIKIPEVKISWIRKNKYKDISVTLSIKEEDYTLETENLLFDSCADWTLYAVVLSQFQNERQETERDITNRLKQKLAYIMQKYCEKEWIDNEVEKQKLYTRNKVTSRWQLSKIQLEQELSMYEAGLL